VVQENRISIGRSHKNDVVVNDEFVSGFHAQLLVCADGTYYLKDAGSSNGIYVVRQGRNQRVTGPEQVRPEEEVSFDNTRITISQLLSKAPPHLASPPALHQNEGYGQNRTRPIHQEPPEALRGNSQLIPGQEQDSMPITPEQAAAGSLGYPQQQGMARVAMGSPVPGEERVIWSGYSSLVYWILGMLWSGLWIIIWLVVAFIYGLPFIALALLAAIGLIRKILLYINTYYEFTSQRIRRRQGVLTLRRNQIELFRLKDFEVMETMFGRLFNYSHIRLISSDRIMPKTVFLAVPNGAELAEKMRKLAQINRAESGIMHLNE